MKDKKILLVGFLLFFIPFALAEPISDDNFECNGFTCGTGWVSGWGYSGTCEIVTTANPIGTYHMRGVSTCDALRQVDTTGYNEVLVSFYATASSLEAADHCQYYYYDGSSYHLLLDLGNGDDDSSHDYYEYDVTSYGLNANAGIRMLSPTTSGDYCYIDNVAITGIVDIQFNIFTDSVYTLSEITQIEMSSSLSDTLHTIELYDEGDSLFCSDVIVSPSSPFTSFFTECTMPSTPQTNAYAKLYETSTPGTATTKYFDVKAITQNSSMLQIKKVYFSPQVLQGGSTEIFLLIEKDSNVTVTSSHITLIFPDDTTRDLSVSPTENINEYRAFVTDTYQTGNVTFTIDIEGGNYYDSYTNKYLVAGYNVDFVDVVNKVSEVAVCKKVEEIPSETMDVFGTEYRDEDIATVFLQLRDSQGFPVLDGTCNFNMYYPYINVTQGHEVYLSNAPMLKLEGASGLYYYDIINLPEFYGVYMLSASCSYSTGQQFVYATDGTDPEYPNRTVIDGTYGSSPIVLNSYVDGLYSECDSGGGAKQCQAYYDYDISSKVANYTDITELHLFYMGEADYPVELYFYIWNWVNSSWMGLDNTLIFSGLALTAPTGLNDFVSNEMPVNDTISVDGIVRIRTDAIYGTGFNQYDNWLNIELVSAYGNIVQLQGSGEIHLNNWFYNYTELISDEVWDWGERQLTQEASSWVGGTEYDIEEEVGKIVVRMVKSDGTPVSGASCNVGIFYTNNTVYLNNQTMTEVSGDYEGMYVYDFSLSGELGVHPYAVDCNQGGKNYFLTDTYHVRDISTEIWNNSVRTLTGETHLWVGGTEYDVEEEYGKIIIRLVDNTDTPVPNANCTLKAFYQNNTLYLTQQMILYVPPLNGTGAGGIYYVDFLLPNETGVYPYGIDCDVVAGASPKHYYLLDTFHVRDIAYEVWNEETRNLTFYNEQSISDHVWNNSNRSLTYTFNIVYDVWNYVIRELTDYREDEISDYVWNNTDRQLTELNFDTTNETQVWEYLNRSLTELNFDTTNETQVWEYVDRQLTALNFDTTDEAAVWNYVNRTLSELNFDTTDEVAIWNYVNRTLTELGFDTTDEAAVWNYYNRTLSEFNFTIDVDTNVTASIDASEIWDYVNRTLTYYPPASVNNTAVANAVWTYEGIIVTNVLEQIASTIWEYLGARAEII